VIDVLCALKHYLHNSQFHFCNSKKKKYTVLGDMLNNFPVNAARQKLGERAGKDSNINYHD